MTPLQLKTPNLTPPAIYDGERLLNSWAGWCIAYVEVAFGTPRYYASAFQAWLATRKKHADRNFPVGVYFPIWFEHYGTYGTPPKYGNWGHVAICKVEPDGRMTIWSSPASNKTKPDTYTSVEAVERIYSAKYVGWSEDLATVILIGGTEMFVYARTLTPLEVKVSKPIMMYNIETNQPLWNSGLAMTLGAKTNIVNGSTFYIPTDRLESGEPYGFREEDVYAKGNEVKEQATAPGQPIDPTVVEDARKFNQFKELFRGLME